MSETGMSAEIRRLQRENDELRHLLARRYQEPLRCDECPRLFSVADLRAENPLAWGHPCPAGSACESHRSPLALLPALPPDDPPRWQPIETAPKSGEFLAWVKRAGLMSALVVHYCDFVEDHPPIDPGLYFWTGHQFAPLQDRPSHWQPLPAGPAAPRPEEDRSFGTNIRKALDILRDNCSICGHARERHEGGTCQACYSMGAPVTQAQASHEFKEPDA